MVDASPRDVTSDVLATILDGQHHGDVRTARRLAAADAPSPDSVVVWPDPEAARVAELALGGVVVIVAAADRAGASLVDAAKDAGVAIVVVRDVRRAMARVSRHFDARPLPAAPGVHPSAIVSATARLGAGVRIGPFCVVADDVELGDDVVLGARCSIGAGSRVGPGGVLFEGVVLYDGVRVGARARFHAGVVIGGDGFGFAAGPRGAEKIHHLGGVVIGDDVELGANTTIDRGTVSNTRIGHRVKMDNLVQVAHNVVIGDDVMVAGLTGFAGSCRVGDRVLIGGACGIADHVTIGDDARLAGRSAVSKDVPPGETWGGMPAQPFRRLVRERYLIGQLERMWASVRGKEPKA
jgi:UDP-3-O-[3-hydroxymyristoyl] glucosamine N-acyltransferase